MKTIEMTRSIESLSMMNPLSHDDVIELDGPEGSNLWTVVRGGYGWQLKRDADGQRITHPAIKDIDSMAGFIGAILEWSRGYWK